MATNDEILTDMFSKLPEEIIKDIFSRIQTKSVGKFRCLSKTWNNRLSTSHFINLHLSRNTHQQSLILLSESKSIHVMKLPIENPTISKELELGNNWTRVLGSCNGLVLLLNSEKEMFLVNPTTLELFKLPDLTFPDSKKHGSFYGFGYDSITDDYKILVFTVFLSNDSEYLCCLYTIVDLYSVKSGVWRRINDCFTDYVVRGYSCGAFTNGSIHWFAQRISRGSSKFTILAFNLATEVIYEIGIPLTMHGAYASCRVFSNEGRLCTIYPLRAEDSISSEKFDVGMMEDYGMLNSWTKLGTVDSNGKWDMCVPLCFSSDGEIVLVTCEHMSHSVRVGSTITITVTDNHNMVVYNLEEGTAKDMVVNGDPASLGDGCLYVDSMVSPK